MLSFLVVFFSIYGAAHYYFYARLGEAVPIGKTVGILISGGLVLLTLGPVAVHVLEKRGLVAVARLSASIEYSWMGFLFLFVCFSVALDGAGVFAGLAGAILGFRVPQIRGDVSFLIPLLLSLAAFGYGWVGAKKVVVERVTLHSLKIPAEAGTIRIVQISDLHLGLLERDSRVDQVVGIVRSLKPDVIVSTGDMVDGQMRGIEHLADALSVLDPPLGKYAVLGNHEFYAGVSGSLSFLRRAGFKVLRGEAVGIGRYFTVVGVDDPVGRRIGGEKGRDEFGLLVGKGGERFVLLLKHRPTWDRHLLEDFDLQLSGHTHGGQVFPFGYLTRLFYPKPGLHRLGIGAHLYVSRGTGTWGPRVRLLSPPEITLITVVGEGTRSGGG